MPNDRLRALGLPLATSSQIQARLTVSSSMVKEERKRLYLKLKIVASTVRDSLFKLVSFDKAMKRKKQILADIVWTMKDEAHLQQSSQVVLALSGIMSKGGRTGVLGSSGGENDNE
jgi:hypothetical protein